MLGFLYRPFYLAQVKYNQDRCTLQASALTFFTLLSIVPILAMMFGIAKGFGFEQLLEQKIEEQMIGHSTAINYVLLFTKNLLADVHSGVIAGLGVIILMITALKLIGNIEGTFNNIWRVSRSRSLSQRTLEYIALLIIGPILLVFSSSLHIFLTEQIQVMLSNYPQFKTLFPHLHTLSKTVPMGLTVLFFSWCYYFFPCTKVGIFSALFAGLISGLLYHHVQWFYIVFQIGVSNYNTTYGGFAALPLFIVWLQVSWVIVLYGAELSYVIHNKLKKRWQLDPSQLNISTQRRIALEVLLVHVERFKYGKTPLNSHMLAKQFKLPLSFIEAAQGKLQACGLLAELNTSDNTYPSFQPARHLDQLSLLEVIHLLDEQGEGQEFLSQSKSMGSLNNTLNELKEYQNAWSKNVHLKDLELTRSPPNK